MKYAAFTCSVLLFISSLALTGAEDPPATTVQRGVGSDIIEENAKYTDAERKQKCPPSPQPKDWLMIPHGGLHTEGCERVTLQDLELDFIGMQKASEAVLQNAAGHLEADKWKTQGRTERAELEGATDIVTRMDAIVRDREAAIALGKAFFWDMQAGSDGQTACASCHFRAGADGRGNSIGVAARYPDSTQQSDEPGCEPSRPLTPEDVLYTYERRWGGMRNIPEFLRQQAIWAFDNTAQQVRSKQVGNLSELRYELERFSLLPDAADIKPYYDGLREQLTVPSTKPDNNPSSIESSALIRIQLAGACLVYIRKAVWTVEQQLELAKDMKARTSDTPSDVNEQQRQAARRLGQMLAPYELRQAGEFKGLNLADSTNELGSSDIARKSQAAQESPAEPGQPVNSTPGRTNEFPNAPSVINAAFHDRLFHNGRATSVFNGYDHLGDNAGEDGFGKWQWNGTEFKRVLIRIPHAALASQATAPLLSAQEMSWFGRQYHHVARKLLPSRALVLQQVPATDSVLGSLSAGPTNGLKTTYHDLIKAAFHPEWWQGGLVPEPRERDAMTGNQLSLPQVEANFSLFWGIALMCYQQTLLSGETQFDELMNARRKGESIWKGLSAEEQSRRKSILTGHELFTDHGCADCHLAPEFAGATFSTVYGPNLEFEPPLDAINAEDEQNEFAAWIAASAKGLIPDGRVESMFFRVDHAPRFYDRGFYNLGVTTDDPDYTEPPLLNETPQAYQDRLNSVRTGFSPGIAGEIKLDLRSQLTALQSVANTFGQGVPLDIWRPATPITYSLSKSQFPRWHVSMGSFKTPTLRNVALTSPYFHDGSERELSGVLDFYRGFAASGKGHRIPNRFLHPALVPDPLNQLPETAIPESQHGAVEAFLESLTDERVRLEKPPFDRPSLAIPTTTTINPLTGRSMLVPVETIK